MLLPPDAAHLLFRPPLFASASSLHFTHLSRDLLPSLNSGRGSHFIHPSLPVSSFSRTGIGSGVEGLTSGWPCPRLALRAVNNTIMLYKLLSPTHRPCCLSKGRAATIFLKLRICFSLPAHKREGAKSGIHSWRSASIGLSVEARQAG